VAYAGVTVDAGRPPVVTLTMRAPGDGNAFTRDMCAALEAGIEQAERTEGARVLVLRSSGADFCLGLSFAGLGPDSWRDRIDGVHRVLTRLASSPLVTIAVVGGRATGGGVGLAAACDHVVAAPQASFRLTEVLFGLVPAIILPWLAARVGAWRAYSLALSARRVSGAEAVGLGLADVCAEAVDSAVTELVRVIRVADAGAVACLKRSVRPSAGAHDYETAMGMLAERFGALPAGGLP
jgi:polyketide biosynthesis enoyl-CoA hydratase PksH